MCIIPRVGGFWMPEFILRVNHGSLELGGEEHPLRPVLTGQDTRQGKWL